MGSCTACSESFPSSSKKYEAGRAVQEVSPSCQSSDLYPPGLRAILTCEKWQWIRVWDVSWDHFERVCEQEVHPGSNRSGGILTTGGSTSTVCIWRTCAPLSLSIVKFPLLTLCTHQLSSPSVSSGPSPLFSTSSNPY